MFFEIFNYNSAIYKSFNQISYNLIALCNRDNFMTKSTKVVFPFSPLASFSTMDIGMSQKHRLNMDDLSLDLPSLNTPDRQKVQSTVKRLSKTLPLYVPSTASHSGTKQLTKHSNRINMKKKIAHKLFYIVCVPGLLGMQQAYAATYYVSPTGSDSNNGTSLSTPVKTISKALSKAQASGDIVYVLTGTYPETLYISQSGITLSAYQGNQPVIDGGTSLPGRDWGTLIDVPGNNNTISGFEVKNSNINGANVGGYGIGVGGKNNTISNMNVHHVWDHGVMISGDHNTFQDSTVSQAVRENYQGQLNATNWGMGLSATHGTYTTLRRNTVYNNWGEGIACFATDHCTLEDNVSYDNWTINLYIGDLTNSLIQRNIVYVSSNPAIAFRDSRHIGLFLDDEQPSFSRSSGNTIINNMFYNADVYAFNWTIVDSGLVNTIIANNTIVDGSLSTGAGSSGGYITNSNSQIKNNIIIGQNSSVPSNSGITFSNNSWSTNPPSAAAASTNIIGDPHVARTGSTAPGALTSAYFKILGSSPVINAATPLNNVPTDFFQASRGTAPDIGGHEFQASTSGSGTTSTTDTTAPSAPSSLGATAGSSTQVSLVWNASTDNVGVTGYRIYRNGTQINTSTATSFTDTTVTAGTSYSYTIKAYDAAGNLSASSNTATVNTPQTSSAVTISSYSAGSLTANSAKINWTTNVPSTGVVSYGTSATNLNSQVSATTSATSQSVQINGLASGTTYYYKISASTGSVTSSFTTSGSSSTGTNIANLASVTASSENVSTNQQAIKAIDGIIDGMGTATSDYTREWATLGQKAGAWLQLKWSANHTVNKIVLYDRPNTDDQITGATLTFSNGSTVTVGALNDTGTATVINFAPVVTNSVKVTVNTVSGKTLNIGLAEIEVYGS
ncbi:MAG: DUF7402 domain-containing protein [Methylobacter sp.]